MNKKVITGNASEVNFRVGIVVSKWNSMVTEKLLEGALEVLERKGRDREEVIVAKCPGAFEIPFTSRALLPKVDGLIALGAVIKGDTPHFDYVCRAVTDGILRLNMEQEKPVLFGVLTTDTVRQALDRAGESTDFGNKGAETALALMEMVSIKEKIDKL